MLNNYSSTSCWDAGAIKNPQEVLSMKHNVKITLIILAMFVVTQFIGLYVTKQVPCSKRILEEIKEPEKIETSKTPENTVEITPNM